MDKIVQIKYARGLQYAKNKICLIFSILFEFSLTNIVFISSFLCLTIIVIFLVVYTYLRYGDKKQ